MEEYFSLCYRLILHRMTIIHTYSHIYKYYTNRLPNRYCKWIYMFRFFISANSVLSLDFFYSLLRFTNIYIYDHTIKLVHNKIMNTVNIHGFAIHLGLNSEISQIHTTARSRFSKYSPLVFQGWTPSCVNTSDKNIHTYKRNTFTQNNTDWHKVHCTFFFLRWIL